MRTGSLFLSLGMLLALGAGTPAQTAAPAVLKAKTLVVNGKKSVEKSSKLVFGENSFTITTRAKGVITKDFFYADVLEADYAFSTKTLLSPGTALTARFILHIYSLPLMFLKKKQHWLSIRTAEDFVVLRLERKELEKVVEQLASRSITVRTAEEGEPVG